MSCSPKRRVVVGVTGASGSVYAVRALEALRSSGVESHLVVSEVGKGVVEQETGLSTQDLEKMADVSYAASDMWAPLASGSYRHDGMLVIPCSMRTLGAISGGLSDNLLVRAADVCLKEFRPLVLVARETPISCIHLENMLRVSRAGGRIVPACPAFYHGPQTVQELVDFVVGKALDALGVENDLFPRWGEQQSKTGGHAL